MVESLQHKLDRVRPPRVQITYDVEIGNAIVMKELPFVVGIMADLSGKLIDPLPRLRDRKFVDIDRDNIEHIMKSIRPRLAPRVANKINPQEEHMSAELFFEDISDFEPLSVVKQIPELDKLYNARVRLKDLMTKLDGNDALDDMLRAVITDADKRTAFK
ncbi:MAG: type VI secretion system contractile sheath small subunit, partial [Alphaproteobacteria bacterium]|nr:type VI secretion system contractile sheath small subunit [Alphaproteobacteria bacterium]